MKWIKRIFITLVVLLLLSASTLFILQRLAKNPPDWYKLDAAALKAAEQSVEDKLIGLHGWAASTKAKENRPPGQPVIEPGGEQPAASRTVTLTENELNVLFRKWDVKLDWKARYGEYLEDPLVVLQDNRIILAARLKDGSDNPSVIGLHLHPKLAQDGKLWLTLEQVTSGRVPLPRALFSSNQEKLTRAMSSKLAQSQRGAKLAADGSMNGDAVGAAMTKLLLATLNDEPAEPVLFFTHDFTHGNNGLPVRLTEITVKDKQLSVTVVPLTHQERQALLARIKHSPKGNAKPAVSAVAE